ncbi:hypothetical protein [Streptomyces sp. NPDC005970]|uniref:hypothetical protein n=1 Tax=Streptomyces sp. NPDC005970 TaxID=3156723 RepID=UPI0033C83EB7
MSDDVIHIVPTEGQSVEEVAEIFSQAAATQGLEGEVQVKGEQVIVPRSLSVSLSNFPPKGDVYQLQQPIDLTDLG